ncbi:hypothetical protein [Cupriavidus sp. CP313]
MKEDILEQMVDEYLQHRGYFTRHNLKFRPARDHEDYHSQSDSVASDIDVIGLHPSKSGSDRIVVVSCKSWQAGFRPKYWCAAIDANKKVGGREAWMGFRELVKPKWADAFRHEIRNATGSDTFTYITAVTRLAEPDRTCWEQNPIFLENLAGNPIRLITFREMLDEVFSDINSTPAASQMGRMLQLIKAAGWSGPSVKQTSILTTLVS